jgi:hypothetical protein
MRQHTLRNDPAAVLLLVVVMLVAPLQLSPSIQAHASRPQASPLLSMPSACPAAMRLPRARLLTS